MSHYIEKTEYDRYKVRSIGTGACIGVFLYEKHAILFKDSLDGDDKIKDCFFNSPNSCALSCIMAKELERLESM